MTFLEDIIKREVLQYSALYELTIQEKTAVIINDVETLSAIIEKQQSALSAIETIRNEKERFLAERQMSIEDAINSVNGELHNKLLDDMEKLKDLSIKLRRLSKLNKSLLDLQMRYTQLSINLISGQESALGTYSGSGHIKEDSAVGHRLVDWSV